MDMLDFDGQDLYFDQPVPAEIQALLARAAGAYGTEDAENSLLRAYLFAPENLSVLVALYRYYYYQHYLEETLVVAKRVIAVSGRMLGLPSSWRDLSEDYLGVGVLRSMGLLRFYLLALKGAGYLCMRLGDLAQAEELLRTVMELDSADRLGAGALLELLNLELEAGQRLRERAAG